MDHCAAVAALLYEVFFLHYGWFLQNLGKEAVRTNMHTTVRCFELPNKTNGSPIFYGSKIFGGFRKSMFVELVVIKTMHAPFYYTDRIQYASNISHSNKKIYSK